MRIIEFLSKLNIIEPDDGLKEYKVKNILGDILWVESAKQYMRDIVSGATAPICVFVTKDDKYRVIDGNKRTELLRICNAIDKGVLSGDYVAGLRQAIRTTGVLKEIVRIDMVEADDLKEVLKQLCIANLTDSEVLRGVYNRQTIQIILKEIAEKNYGISKWHLADDFLLDTLVTYITGFETHSRRVLQLNKKELLQCLESFDNDEFFKYLIDANDFTGEVTASFTDDYRMNRFVVSMTTAYHIARKENKLVRSVQDLKNMLLSQDSQRVLRAMSNIKTSISSKLYKYIKITSYLYLTGATDSLDWEDNYSKYSLY